MSQRNIERQYLTMTPLEIARTKSAENLRTYNLELTNGVGNLNYISRIKHKFREENPNIDYFDDYSVQFFEVVKKFQRENGLKADGVLDIDFLVKFDKKYPLVFNEQEKARILNYFQNRTNYIATETIYIKTETKEKILNSELDLVADNIGVPKNQVLEKVRNSLGLTGSIEEMRKQIAKFQEMSCLNEKDGTIGKETYYEIVAKDYFTVDKIVEINEKGPSNADKKIILEIFRNGRIGSIELNKLSYNLQNFKQKNLNNPNFERDFGQFYRDYEVILGNYKNSPQGKADIKMVEENSQSFYSIIKDDNLSIGDKVKQIATDPTTLFVGGALFLFGVVGGDSKYTNSFFKRLGWILGGALFGPAVWNKLGIGEIVDDATKTVRNVKTQAENNSSVATEQEAKVKAAVEGLPNYIQEKARDAGKSLEDAGRKGREQINSMMGDLKAKNETFKTSRNESEKDKYIEATNFHLISTTLNDDSTLANTKVSDLERDKSDISKIKNYLSQDTKNKLYPEKQTPENKTQMDKDLKNYIELLLTKKKSDNVYMSDIVFGKGFIATLVDTVTDNVKYHNDEKINAKIEENISKISVQEQTGIKTTLFSVSLNPGEKYNKLEETLKRTDLIEIDRKQIEILKDIYLLDKNYNDFISELEKVDVNGGQTSLEKANKLKNDFDEKTKGYRSGEGSILNIYKEKVSELLGKKLNDISEKTPNKTEAMQDILNKGEYERNFENIFLKIGDKPNHSLDSYRTYFSDNERIIAYNNLHSDNYICRYTSVKCENSILKLAETYDGSIDDKGNIKPDVKFDSEEEKTEYLKSYRVFKARENYDKMVDGINSLANEDINKLDRILREIKEAKENPELFAIKQDKFKTDLEVIINRIYPNQKPESFTDLNGFVNYMNDKNRKSFYTEIKEKLKAVDSKNLNLSYDFDEKVMGKLTEVSNSLSNSQTEVKNETQTEKMSVSINTIPEIATSYNTFYQKVPEEARNLSTIAKLPEPGVEVSVAGLIGALNSFNKAIDEHTKKAEYQKLFSNEFNAVRKSINDYKNQIGL